MIESDIIDQVNSQVVDLGLDEQAVSQLRDSWPNIHFTYCSDDDISAARPVRQSAGFNIYLVDGRDHCLKFTSDIEHATGLVLAELEAEEDELEE